MTTIHVCPIKDIECGKLPKNWCKDCPLIGAQPIGHYKMTEQEMREAFEAAMVAEGGEHQFYMTDGAYRDHYVGCAFAGFKMGLKVAEESIAADAARWRLLIHELGLSKASQELVPEVMQSIDVLLAVEKDAARYRMIRSINPANVKRELLLRWTEISKSGRRYFVNLDRMVDALIAEREAAK